MECDHHNPKWVGRCPNCEAWNTLVEEIEPRHSGAMVRGHNGFGSGLDQSGTAGTLTVVPMTRVRSDTGTPVPTGVEEVDRVLGGGLVPGSVTLLGGEPGVGKSTLVMQILAESARHRSSALYVTGEESVGQVRSRAERLGALEDGIGLLSATSLSDIVAVITDTAPEIVVIDSIQTVFTEDVPSAPGSVAQVRECAYRLVQLAKATDTTVILVGHVTKDGNLAGPRALEHIVDTVLGFDGDRHNALRMLRAHKHRFGSTEELGIFVMAGSGLESVPNPSAMFLGDRRPGAAGSIVTCTLQGHRPLLVEIQTLVAPSAIPNARRSTQGMDAGRLSLLLAVLATGTGMRSQGMDVYANVVGGVRVTGPDADLAIALSLISSVRDRPIADSVVACGEIGLGGEIRAVPRLERRLSEAVRMGFSTALVPASTPSLDMPIDLVRVPTIQDAARHLRLG